MKMRILYPSCYEDLNQVEEQFELEKNAAETCGFETGLFDFDLFFSEDKLKVNAEQGEYIYRGYMLDNEKYNDLYKRLYSKGIELFTTPTSYINCHYFPNVYRHIEGLTPRIAYFKYNEKNLHLDLTKAVNELGVDFFVKDYVKSVKRDERFLKKINKNYNIDKLVNFVTEFKEEREPLFFEGIVLKEWFNNLKFEQRAFYYKGQLISLTKNNNDLDHEKINDKFVKDAGEKLSGLSPFYTIDFAKSEKGWIIIECGDGSVSGLSPNQNELKYYSKLKEML
jgi:ATP-grasp domain, R2K clade family 3